MKKEAGRLFFILSLLFFTCEARSQDNVPPDDPYGPAPDAPADDATGAADVEEVTPEANATDESGAQPGTAETPPEAEGVDGDVTSEAIKTEDVGTYSVRLRDMEQRINLLKEQIFKAKARLSLLAESVLDRKIAGSKAIIVFNNEMSSSFRMAKAIFSLDGAPIFNKIDEDGSLAERETFEIFNGNIVPGDHTLSVLIEYQGHGHGIFAYLKGYKFRVRSSHTFTAAEAHTLNLKIIGHEKGGITTSLEERPAIKFVENVKAEESKEKSK